VRSGVAGDIASELFLEADGVAVRDRFLSQAHCQALIDCAQQRRARGDFAAARIGGDHLQRRAEIRGDSICWIAAPLLPAEQILLAELEELRLALNRTLLLGLFDLELHYAWYPPGAGYARHVDQPHGQTQRQVSLALYLNADWTPQAGGELRIFGAAHGYRDIAPVGGRLVSFLTSGREHAVLATHRERLSISGWFRTRS
jgi:SM-20-related protein